MLFDKNVTVVSSINFPKSVIMFPSDELNRSLREIII